MTRGRRSRNSRHPLGHPPQRLVLGIEGFECRTPLVVPPLTEPVGHRPLQAVPFLLPLQAGIINKPRPPNPPANQWQSRLASRNRNKKGPPSNLNHHSALTRRRRNIKTRSASSEEPSKKEKPDPANLERDTGSPHQAAVVALSSEE